MIVHAYSLLLVFDWTIPLFVLLGVGYMCLIYYVSQANKVAPENPVIHISSNGEHTGLTADLIAQINSVHVQQFLANTISVLEAFTSCKEKMNSLPELNSAFPFRRFQEQVLTESDLQVVVSDLLKTTNIPEKTITKYIQRNKNEFRKLQGQPLSVGYFEKVEVRKIVHEIESKHEKFNGFEILHLEDLKNIFREERVEVIALEDLEVLSAIIEYKDKQQESVHGVLIKKGKDVHPALREFALAHELGHWFAHIKNDQIRTNPDRDFYLHSLHDLGPFENEANKIAMIALFPTPYLSWCDVFETLNPAYLFEEFTKGMPHVGKRLETNMTEYMKRRIDGYHKFRQDLMQELRLPDKALTEASVRALLDHILVGEVSWARLDENDIVVDANETYAALFRITKTELVEGKYHLVDDLTVVSLRVNMREQLKRKRETLKPKFYLTQYKSPVTTEVIPVTIYAFPIVDEKGTYKGSLGVVTDRRSRKSGSVQ